MSPKCLRKCLRSEEASKRNKLSAVTVSNSAVTLRFLGVSVDYLLDEGEKLSFNETKEPIDLSSFKKTGKRRSREDAACLSRFKDADAIYPLLRSKKLNKKESILDFLIFPGILNVADGLEDASSYYLVESGNKRFLVNVTKDFIITRELSSNIDTKKFEIGTNKFKKAAYRLN